MDAGTWLEGHRHVLLAAARGVLRAPEDVQDAAQEAALHVWRRWSSFDATRGTREAWSFTIARRAAIDLRRRLSAQQKLAASLLGAAQESPTYRWAVAGADLVDVEREALQRERLRAGWRWLDPASRDVVTLGWAGYTDREISRRLALPLGTVKTRRRRARRLARAGELVEQGDVPAGTTAVGGP